jgi:uncharacterized damage-inducible protein DinB
MTMAEDSSMPELFLGEWRKYEAGLAAALAPLSREQLALRAAPHLLSIGELAQHIVAVRAYWFHGLLGEGDEAVAAYAIWDEPGAPARDAAELRHGLEASWTLMAEALTRWTPAELRQTFASERDGRAIQLSRAWVVWHVLEQNLHHGGELTVTLNQYGIAAPDL